MEHLNKQKDFWNIRNTILVFSLLITLVPFLGMGWLLNEMKQTAVTEKSEQRLRHTSTIIKREIALWLKERNYDLYVFSNSFVISENYGKSLAVGKTDNPTKENQGPFFARMIETYLSSVQKQFENYSKLAIFDPSGEVVASSSGSGSHVLKLPDDYKEQIEKNTYFHSDIYFPSSVGFPCILLGSPLYSDQFEKYVGILVMEVKLKGVAEILDSALDDVPWESRPDAVLYNLNSGQIFLSTEKKEANSEQGFYGKNLKNSGQNRGLKEFVNHKGEKVVGVLASQESLRWGIIVAENYDDLFSRVILSRNRNLLIVGLLGVIIGCCAYVLARKIIRPLQSLTNGAQRVADGDLDVLLPIEKNDELGLATHVFNDMVAELKQNQQELEQLATTDSLTGLANRKHVMEGLSNLHEHYKRYSTVFSILMIDIDHFKKINDTYGHQIGDSVLSEVGRILEKSIRSIDIAGRYGGEEFLVLLSESAEDEAIQAAERIRNEVAEATFHTENGSVAVTVSIGLATIDGVDGGEKSLVKRADDALYLAKSRGRDQCVFLPEGGKNKKGGNLITLQRTAEK